MEFRLTYAGPLLAHKDDGRLRERSLHIHEIRKIFHKQLMVLWAEHPVLRLVKEHGISASPVWSNSEIPRLNQVLEHDGFSWLPMVTEQSGLICKLDILMLRHGQPGCVLYDIDNRLKTLFDALRKARGSAELGFNTGRGQVSPDRDETPFFVLLEDDRLITHVSVSSDALLEPVPNVRPEQAVRLVIGVTVRPYKAFPANSGYV